jgi:hypothetical protein
VATMPMPLQGQQNWAGNLPTGAQAAQIGTVSCAGNSYYTTPAITFGNVYPITTVTQIPNETVWVQWNQQYYQGLGNLGNQLQQENQVAGVGVLYTETEEVRQQRQKHLEQVEEASKKARTLLVRHLSKPQQEQLEVQGAFELEVNDRLYRVRPGARVERINKKTRRIESYFCIHPESHHRLPAYDVALSQKLLLEANEREFLSIANETRAA